MGRAWELGCLKQLGRGYALARLARVAAPRHGLGWPSGRLGVRFGVGVYAWLQGTAAGGMRAWEEKDQDWERGKQDRTRKREDDFRGGGRHEGVTG